jgi:D-arabinose 1-dehydrogenase-like Zn-dependent alcohol dehydrogenase
MLQMLRAFGAFAIAVERSATKAAELERLGLADVVIQPDGDDWAEDVRRAADDRLAGIVDTVGASSTLAPALDALGTAGALVVLGYRPGSSLTLDPGRLLFRELVVTGTRYATRVEIARSLELVRQGRVRPVIGARYALSELEAAFAAIRANEVFGRILIDRMDQ